MEANTTANEVLNTIQPFTGDYADVLTRYGFTYNINGNYLQIGVLNQVHGWLLHLSAIEYDLTALLHCVLPILNEHKVPFKIPANSNVAASINAGYYGLQQLGKLITIYPPTDEQALAIAIKLAESTVTFKGPIIPTDVQLGGSVFTRYGAFNPVCVTGTDGNVERYIYDGNGQLIIDEYHIPFMLPKDRKWPFTQLASPTVKKKGRLLNGKYLPTQYLKKDAKGDVIKANNLKKIWSINECIIKQGRQYMNADLQGRDIRDRLKWQYELHKRLAGLVSIPKALDFFELDGDSYFVMQVVEGTDLSEVIAEISQGRTWFAQEPAEQRRQINLLLQVIDAIEKLHSEGVLHRDLNARNFLVTENGKVTLIDVELAYDMREKRPEPPFVLGTPGYMSPEQWDMEPATVEQDIYGIGALMIKVFTGLQPTKFNVHDPELLEESLEFLIRNNSLATLIARCVSYDPALRPELETIKKVIGEYVNSLDHRVPQSNAQLQGPEPKKCEVVIKMALTALATPPLLSDQLLWHSKTIHADRQLANELVDFSFYPGLHEGISGVLYMLSEGRKAGFDTEGYNMHYNENLNFLKKNYLANIPNILPGYYTGAAGIALALASGIKAGLIEKTPQMVDQVRTCLSLPNQDINIATGIAGQGLAALYCGDYLPQLETTGVAQEYAQALVSLQEKDGSWLLRKVGVQEKGIKILGFSYGIAGIIYFLLEYGIRTGHGQALEAANKGLVYLEKQSIRENERLYWYTNATNKHADPWFDYGFSGVAFTFLKAFKVLGNPAYKRIATGALVNHPLFISSPYLNISNGLTGLGNIYLQAAVTLESDEWQQRADWIASYLLQVFLNPTDNSLYWLTGASNITTADLMEGNSGVIHYLMRYLHPNKISFPLFH